MCGFLHWPWIASKHNALGPVTLSCSFATAIIKQIIYGFGSNEAVNEANDHLQMAKTIMDERHPKWEQLLHVVSHFDKAQKNM